MDPQEAAKRAFLIHDQLADLRQNARHICDLPGIVAFVRQFNAKMEEVRTVVAADESIVAALAFLRAIDDDVSESEYPSAIIDGKRGLFMVASGVLMNTLENFMRLYMADDDRARLGADEVLRRDRS